MQSSGMDARQNEIGDERNEPADDVGESDRIGACKSSLGIRTLETELELHHKVHPRFWPALKGTDDWLDLGSAQSVRCEELLNFPNLGVRNLRHLRLFAQPLFFVVFRIAPGGEVSAQTHCDRSRSNFCQTRGHDDSTRGNRSGESRCQSKRNREAIGHADHDVTNTVGTGKMAFDVTRGWQVLVRAHIEREYLSAHLEE